MFIYCRNLRSHHRVAVAVAFYLDFFETLSQVSDLPAPQPNFNQEGQRQ